MDHEIVNYADCILLLKSRTSDRLYSWHLHEGRFKFLERIGSDDLILSISDKS